VPIVKESRAGGNTRYDVPGAVLATGGLLALVYAFTKAAEDGWAAGNTMTYFAIAAVLLVGFVVVEARTANPLLPLRVVLHRNRGGSFLVSVLIGAGMMGMFLFMTYYFQGTLRYTPLESGVAYLPFSGALIVTAIIGGGILPRVGPRAMMTAGGVLATTGMVWLTQLRIDSPYLTFILPALTIMAVGMALVFVPLGNTALSGVSDHDAGVASAMVNTTQQVGASLGVALLNTVFTNATASYIRANGPEAAPLGVVHGYNVAFTVSAALIGAAAIAVFLLIRTRRQAEPGGPDPVETPVLATAPA
jgi:predicted MFS family arabinose efflux permease